MDEDENIAEDGEIVDDDSDYAGYTPLERPADYSATVPIRKFPEPVSESEDELQSASDSDSDSDCKSYRAKKPKVKLKPKARQQENLKRKKYDIWSTRVQEDVLAETLNSCDVTYKDRSRDVESYDYTLGHKYYDSGKDRLSNKRSRSERNNPNLRLKKLSSGEEKVICKSAARTIMDLTVTLENSPEEIASDIANKLCEEKEELLVKIINIAGKEKAFETFKETKRIEADGGMLIMNQTRRRTPGGVYLFLLRQDSDLSRQQVNEIFDEDRQKYKETMKQRKRIDANKMKPRKVNNSYKNLPDLLTRAEICVQKLADENNRTRKESTNVDVINPPPTPETDCLENSGDGMDNTDDTKIVNVVDSLDSTTRKIESYDLDFLDIGSGNNMDLF